MSAGGRASWSRRIDALRKEGRLQEALELARHAYSESPQSRPVKRSYGWAIYARAREHVEGFFKELRLRSPEARQRRESSMTQLDFLLREYAEAQLPRRDLCLSLLLVQVTRPREAPQCLPKVLSWVGLDGLREEDLCASEGAEGQLYPSLIERLAERVAQVAVRRERPRACELALAWISAASAKAAPLIYAEALSSYRGPLLRLSGRVDEAVSYALRGLSRNRHDARSWREWSLCERERSPTLALWLGLRAAYEARAQLSAEQLTLWAERLAQVADEAEEPQAALALGLWALEQRGRFSVPVDEDTLYLTRRLGGLDTLELELYEGLRSLDQRALRLSEESLGEALAQLE